MAQKSPVKAIDHQISNYGVISATEDGSTLELKGTSEKKGEIKKGDTVTFHRADGSPKKGTFTVKKIAYSNNEWVGTFEQR
jgi:hypothetical protein